MIAGFFYLWGLVVVVNLYGVGWVWLLGLVVGFGCWVWLLGLVWVGWFRFVFLFGMGLLGVNYLAFGLRCGLMFWLVPLA